MKKYYYYGRYDSYSLLQPYMQNRTYHRIAPLSSLNNHKIHGNVKNMSRQAELKLARSLVYLFTTHKCF